MIRVFPRKTKWTPQDTDCRFGPPDLADPHDVPVMVSVTFTWDIPKARELHEKWDRWADTVHIGGPAFGDAGTEFVAGRFIKPGVTITSRGCPKRCRWCLVSSREGPIRELPIVSGYNVQDNNLLACSQDHIEAVFAMLTEQREPAVFGGGLDLDYLQPWHVDRLKAMRLKALWVACDTQASLTRLDKGVDMLADISTEKKRCYVLIGFNGESLRDAEARCEAVYEKGFLPFAMLYRDGGGVVQHSREWKQLQRRWARPRIYRSKKGAPQ